MTAYPLQFVLLTLPSKTFTELREEPEAIRGALPRGNTETTMKTKTARRAGRFNFAARRDFTI